MVSAASPGTSDRHHGLCGPGSHSPPEWIAYKDHQTGVEVVQLTTSDRSGYYNVYKAAIADFDTLPLADAK